MLTCNVCVVPRLSIGIYVSHTGGCIGIYHSGLYRFMNRFVNVCKLVYNNIVTDISVHVTVR